MSKRPVVRTFFLCRLLPRLGMSHSSIVSALPYWAWVVPMYGSDTSPVTWVWARLGIATAMSSAARACVNVTR